MRTVGGTASTAIDFGTTHTVASVATGDGRVQSVLFDSSPLLSSAVYAGEDRLVAGRDAERSARLDPSRFEPNPKRHIDDGTLLLGAREYPITEVVAAVLGRALADANRVAGGPTGRVPLTYPANWSGQRPGRRRPRHADSGAGRRGHVLHDRARATTCRSGPRSWCTTLAAARSTRAWYAGWPEAGSRWSRPTAWTWRPRPGRGRRRPDRAHAVHSGQAALGAPGRARRRGGPRVPAGAVGRGARGQGATVAGLVGGGARPAV